MRPAKARPANPEVSMFAPDLAVEDEDVEDPEDVVLVEELLVVELAFCGVATAPLQTKLVDDTLD